MAGFEVIIEVLDDVPPAQHSLLVERMFVFKIVEHVNINPLMETL